MVAERQRYNCLENGRWAVEWPAGESRSRAHGVKGGNVTTGARPRPRVGWVGVKNREQKLASSEGMVQINRHAFNLGDVARGEMITEISTYSTL